MFFSCDKTCTVTSRVTLKSGNVLQPTEIHEFSSQGDAEAFCEDLESDPIFSNVICHISCK